jgi:hypothetical protein
VLRHGRSCPLYLEKIAALGKAATLPPHCERLRHFLVVQDNKLLFAHALIKHCDSQSLYFEFIMRAIQE